MADTHVLIVLIENKFIWLLVDGVVGQVHADIFHVLFVGSDVVFSGETGQSISEDEKS